MMGYICITLSVGIIFLSCSLGSTIETVRPIKIKVIDAYTNKPLKDIRVYRTVEACENVNTILFGLLPRPEPKRVDRIIIKDSAITNVNGTVIFERKEVVLKKNEHLLRERIFINIVVNESVYVHKRGNDPVLELNDCFFYSPSCDRFVTNVNKKYKGAYVFSPCYEIHPDDLRWSEAVHFTLINISNGILKNSEDITVKLKYFDGKPVKYPHGESDKAVAEFKKAWKEYREKKLLEEMNR